MSAASRRRRRASVVAAGGVWRSFWWCDGVRCCVAVAGLYGAATAAKKILFVQTVPAAIGLALVLLS